MIGRLLLLLVAIVLVVSGVRDWIIDARYDAPVKLSVDEFQKLGRRAPAFVQIHGAVPVDGVCITTKEDEDALFEMKHAFVPLITQEQSDLLAQGRRIQVSTFVEYFDCLMPTTTLVRGIVRSSWETSDAAQTRDFLATQRIDVGNKVVIVDPKEEPPSGGIWSIAFGLLFGFVALFPFVARPSWPKEDDVRSLPLESQLASVHPILSTHRQRGVPPAEAIARSIGEPGEVLLLRINCEDSSSYPSVAVVTNERYILYRTHSQWFVRLLGLIGRLLDQVPIVGGILAWLFEPFIETFAMITNPRPALYRENMGYTDDELVAGRVPWKTKCNLSWSEVAKGSDEISVYKPLLANRIDIAFGRRWLLRRAASAISVPHLAVRPVLFSLAAELQPILAEFGCTLELSEKDLKMHLPHQEA